ncbi:hypothetical protein MPER_01281, partial [Moniliophthora perniciosa FA553]
MRLRLSTEATPAVKSPGKRNADPEAAVDDDDAAAAASDASATVLAATSAATTAGDSVGVTAIGLAGPIGVATPDDLPFNADCLGGLGGLVELECLPFVSNLDMLAVAFDAPASAGVPVAPAFCNKAGGRNTIWYSWLGDTGAGAGVGCSSRILRSSNT